MGAGSGWVEYQKSGTICSLPLPPGLQESQQLPTTMFTPSTKADVGQHGALGGRGADIAEKQTLTLHGVCVCVCAWSVHVR